MALLTSLAIDPLLGPSSFTPEVGSQGDGAVQFVAKDRNSAASLKKILDNKLGTEAIIVPIGEGAGSEHSHERQAVGEPLLASKKVGTVRTAVIPAAGFGTRLFPASRSIRPKALFPIVDSDGFAKPLILYLVEQCAKASIDRVIVVVGPGEQEERVREVFAPVEKDLYAALKPQMREYADRIAELASRIEIAVQPEPKGFGDAVACAQIEEDCPFALLLGDVAFTTSNPKLSCLRQLIEAFEGDPSKSVIGITKIPVSEAGAYGSIRIAKNDWACDSRVSIQEIVEKPNSAKAEELSMGGHCNIVLGPYVFTPALMRQLRKDVRNNRRQGGEIQLTTAMESVLKQEGLDALRIDGEALDTGNAREYVRAFARLGK